MNCRRKRRQLATPYLAMAVVAFAPACQRHEASLFQFEPAPRPMIAQSGFSPVRALELAGCPPRTFMSSLWSEKATLQGWAYSIRRNLLHRGFCLVGKTKGATLRSYKFESDLESFHGRRGSD